MYYQNELDKMHYLPYKIDELIKEGQEFNNLYTNELNKDKYISDLTYDLLMNTYIQNKILKICNVVWSAGEKIKSIYPGKFTIDNWEGHDIKYLRKLELEKL